MAGVPFLANLLGASARLIVEAAWGADLTASPGSWSWTDITTDVRQASGQQITITIGRPDEFSQAPPATCAFQLKNQAGAYTPYSPAASNYPNVRPNTPIRVRVTLDGSNFFTRFQGYAVGFTPGWDAAGRSAYVAVSAAGVLRRLGQGNTPLRSALTQWHLNLNPAALWPLDDGSNATFAGSALLTGSSPLMPSGIVTFGQLGNLAGIGAGVAVTPGASASGSISGALATGFLAIDIWVQMFTSAIASTITGIARINATVGVPAIRIYTLNAIGGPPGVRVDFTDSTGSVTTLDSSVGTPGSSVDPYDGKWHNAFVTMTQSGGNINTVLYVDGAVADSKTITGFTLGAPIGTSLTNINVSGNTGNVTTSGLAIHTNSSATTSYTAGLGYPGEFADARLTRLCGDQDVPITITGTSATRMGAQSVDTFANLARECETADVGLLYDGLGAGIAYATRASRYNQTVALTIDANAGQVPTDPALSPLDDDQRRRNLVIAQRSNGSFATYQDTSGPLGTNAVGTYDTQLTVNTDSDATLTNYAAWQVHLGTVEGLRYASLYGDLAGAPELASAWLATTPAERIDLVNLSNRLTQHPAGTVPLVMEGYAEAVSKFQWRITANCSPYQPWNVDALGTTFRLELAGQTLASNLNPGAITLSLATAAGNNLFTTSARFPADFPTDLVVAGWRIHVTDASGSSSPQTLTIDPAPNTSTISSGTKVSLWRPACLAL